MNTTISPSPTLLLYAELRKRQVVRISQTNPFADRLVRKVLEHPDFATIILPKLRQGFSSSKERTQWMQSLNFTNKKRHKLTWLMLQRYITWSHQGQPGQEAAPSEMLTSIGAGDKGSSGRKRAIRTPSSLEFEQTHGLRIGEQVVPLYRLHSLIGKAPAEYQPLLRKMVGAQARQQPIEPCGEMIEAIEWLAKQLKVAPT